MDVSSWWVPYINSWKKYCSHTIFLFNIRTKKSVGQKTLWLILNFQNIHFWQGLSRLPKYSVLFLVIKDSFPGICLDRWMEKIIMLPSGLKTCMWAMLIFCSSFFVVFKLQLSPTKEWSHTKVKITSGT